MELCEFLVILLSVLTFLGECPAGTVATRLCPVRAEPVSLAEVNGEVRCACTHPFYGKNCELTEQNGTIILNATRLTEDLVMVSWREKDLNTERRYRISVRIVIYTFTRMLYKKWNKGTIQYNNVNGRQSESWLESKIKEMAYAEEAYTLPGLRAQYSAVLRLPDKSSYEVKISTLSSAGDYIGSTSIFLEASDAFVPGKMLGISDKLNQFKNMLVKNFNDECALKGIVIGAIVGSIGMLILMAVWYVMGRYCCKCKKHRASGLNQQSQPQEDALEDVRENARENEIEKLSRSSSYVVIEMQDIEFTTVEIPTTEGPETVDETENAAFDPADGAKDVVELPTSKKTVILNILETVIDGTQSQPDHSDDN